MWMLAPATISVVALMVLAVGLRRVARETVELRGAVRRYSATAVAGDELMRVAAAVGSHARATRAALDDSRRRWRLRSRRSRHR